MQETFYEINAPVELWVALLSDFHNGDPGPIIASLQTRRPGLLCVTGDLLAGHRPGMGASIVAEQRNVTALLGACAALAPTYVSLGNHEWMINDEDIARLNATGARVLDNSWRQEKGVVVGGLTSAFVTRTESGNGQGSPHYSHWKREVRTCNFVPETKWLDEFEAQSDYKLLLCHHPEYWPYYLAERKVNLVLSGHAHGGQFRYYSLRERGWRGLYAPGQGWFPKYTGGIYEERLVVSRGLSNTAGIPRLFNPTELVYLHLGGVYSPGEK